MTKECFQKSKAGGEEMRFGNSDYAIFALAGSQEGTRFCTVEELVKGSANRICVYSSKGDLLSESRLGVEGSDLEVNASLRRAMVYSYSADTVTLFNLESFIPILQRSCEEPQFLGFVENTPIMQDVSGKISLLDEASGETSLIGETPPILAWSSDGGLRMIKDGDDSILVTNKDGRGLFSIPRLGLTCFNPSISIEDVRKDILLIEPGAGLRLFSASDHQCKLRLESTKDVSFEFACLGGDGAEVISLAYDQNTEHDSIFYRTRRDQASEICRVGFAPGAGVFLEGGTVFASDTGELINLGASR